MLTLLGWFIKILFINLLRSFTSIPGQSEDHVPKAYIMIYKIPVLLLFPLVFPKSIDS